jgi:hypothetical protein
VEARILAPGKTAGNKEAFEHSVVLIVRSYVPPGWAGLTRTSAAVGFFDFCMYFVFTMRT